MVITDFRNFLIDRHIDTVAVDYLFWAKFEIRQFNRSSTQKSVYSLFMISAVLTSLYLSVLK